MTHSIPTSSPAPTGVISYSLPFLIKVLGTIALLLAMGASVSNISMAQPSIRTVCPSGCNYTAIQTAIDTASSGDTIIVAGTVYTESLVISKNLTLQGAGSDKTFILSNSDTATTLRVLANTAVILNGVTVSNGFSGIDNSGVLTITASVISNNKIQGGIVNRGVLTMHESIVRENYTEGSSGGGIYNSGNTSRLAIYNSTIRDNRAIVVGGALANTNGGAVFITGSSIINNHSVNNGGIFNHSGLLRVTNSTFNGNHFVNVFNVGGFVLLQSSTISGTSTSLLQLVNTGAGAIFKLHNSIIIGGCFNESSSLFISDGYNLSNQDSCFLTHLTDKPNNLNAHLRPLQVNKPGATATYALLPGSAAMDAGDCRLDEPIDQRGIIRPQGRHCDIGAYEVQAPTTVSDHYSTTVNSPLRVAASGVLNNDSNPDSGQKLTVIKLSDSANGALLLNPDGSFTYTPVLGFTGTDSFTYRANDGLNDSNVATIFITVYPQPTITVTLDVQPDSATNFNFEGPLGPFTLDDSISDDGDAYTKTQSIPVATGIYIFKQQNLTGWFLTNITCNPLASAVIDLVTNSLTTKVAIGDNINCTFTSQRASQITAGVYNDHDHNHTFDLTRGSFDEWLSGWELQLSTSLGIRVGAQTTNATGIASFTNLRPGDYIVCVVMQPGWFNITPSVLTRPYQKPCYPVTVNPGQAVAVRFGNSTTPLVAAAEEGEFGHVIFMDLPDTDDDGNEVTPLPDPWPDVVEEQVNTLFLPLVAR